MYNLITLFDNKSTHTKTYMIEKNKDWKGIHQNVSDSFLSFLILKLWVILVFSPFYFVF